MARLPIQVGLCTVLLCAGYTSLPLSQHRDGDWSDPGADGNSSGVANSISPLHPPLHRKVAGNVTRGNGEREWARLTRRHLPRQRTYRVVCLLR